jgi:cytochrome c oxidase assembly protein subunit 15
MFTSPSWKRGLPIIKERHETLRLPSLCALTTGVIYVQLILGALMRHTQSGLAIPDFPLAFGRIIPPMTSSHVMIHFAHRLGAVAVTTMIIWTYLRIRRHYGDHSLLRTPATVMLILVCTQVTLGAFTIWTAKSVVVTTLHVATGALVLGSSVVLLIRAFTMVRDRQPAVVYPILEAAWQ